MWLIDLSGGRVIWKLIVPETKEDSLHIQPHAGGGNNASPKAIVRTRLLCESAFLLCAQSLFMIMTAWARSVEIGDVEKERKGTQAETGS